MRVDRGALGKLRNGRGVGGWIQVRDCLGVAIGLPDGL